MANLLFDWLGFSHFGFVELDRDLQVWQIPTSQTEGQSSSCRNIHIFRVLVFMCGLVQW